MATLIPTLSQCARRMTPGEKRLAERFMAKLEDDYLCWYDIMVGKRSRYPDFIVLHPRRGLLVLEVKDWKLDIIHSADKNGFTLITPNGHKVTPSPLEQARQCAQTIHTKLEADPLLREQKPGYGDRLCLPYGYGVVFTNITRRAFERAQLDEIILGDRVICRDEMTEEVDAELFQKRLWGMFTVHFKTVLSMPQIDRIRWHLFPEIRIPAQSELFESTQTQPATAQSLPELLRVMDLKQEQLARNLGEGHRVIHGVAGSGKTLILGYRCERLASALTKPVLVLCYNVALAAKLRSVMQEKNLTKQVNVRTFHAWCRDQLRLYHVPMPAEGEAFFAEMVNAVMGGVEKGQIPRAQYGAVMIDEGHDFQPEWFRLVTQMIDPETNSLLVLYDDAQSIYEATSRRKFSFSSVGIQAKGRTTILRLNYRNTTEVLTLAYEFARDFLAPEEAEEDGVPLVEPQSGGRHGPIPVIRRLPNLQAEAELIAKEFKALHRAGWRWRDLAIIYRSKFIGERVTAILRTAGLSVEWVGEEGKRRFDPLSDTVKIITMHSSKGLEFPVVAIPGIGYMPNANFKFEDEGRLLYVAMTRAMEVLLMTSHQDTEFVARIERARKKLAA
jgi:UvrD-like helicase C-terminal domain/Nuclease-related domain/AAA domain